MDSVVNKINEFEENGELKDKLKKKLIKLHAPSGFPIIRDESTFEFISRESGSRNTKNNITQLHEFYQKCRHLKPIERVTKRLLSNVRRLEKRFPNFSEVIGFIEDNLTLQFIGNKVIKIPPIYIWGEPGIGKTEFILALSEVLNVGMEKYNAAQMNGAMVLAGSEPQWSDSSPGLVSQAMIRSKTANFIFFLDELEKTFVSNSGGDPLNALYDLLEERSACRYVDQAYTGSVLFDATSIIFIAAGNGTKGVHAALLSRFNVFEIPLPTASHLKTIVHKVYERLLAENEWGGYFDSKLDRKVVESMIKDGQSVRDLKKTFTRAFSRACKHGRTFLTVDDIIFNNVKATNPMGFY